MRSFDAGQHFRGVTIHRTLRLLAAGTLLAALGGCAASEGPAPQFTAYHLDVEAFPDGEIRTVLDLAYDFQDEASHGVYLLFNTYTDVEREDGRLRHTPITSVSELGGSAPQPVRTEEVRAGLAIYLGEEDTTVSGEQRYRLFYAMEGLLDTGTGVDGTDELYWNIIGSDFEDPIDDIEIRWTGPAEIVTAECWAGPVDSTESCDSTHAEGRELVVEHDHLDPGEGITLGIAFEPGAFEPQEPKYSHLPPRETPSWVFAIVAMMVGGVFGLGSYIAVAWRLRDERFLEEIPGLEPVDPAAARVGRAGFFRPRPPVAFTPPEGLTPAQAAMLIDPRTTSHLVPAMIIDLAVRGFLTITTIDGGMELTKVQDPPPSPLAGSDRFVLEGLFTEGDTLTIVQPNPQVPKVLAATPAVVLSELKENGWMKGGHGRARRILRWVSMISFLLLMIIASQLAKTGVWQGVVVLAAPLSIALGATLALEKTHRRTATGYAKYEQALGFNKYLRKAESYRLQFEADSSIFSRYLPYATVFGHITTWIKTFESLAETHTYPTPWLNGGAISLLTDPAARKSFDGGLGGASVVTSHRGSFSGTGGGRVGGGLGGGGGGRW